MSSPAPVGITPRKRARQPEPEGLVGPASAPANHKGWKCIGFVNHAGDPSVTHGKLVYVQKSNHKDYAYPCLPLVHGTDQVKDAVEELKLVLNKFVDGSYECSATKKQLCGEALLELGALGDDVAIVGDPVMRCSGCLNDAEGENKDEVDDHACVVGIVRATEPVGRTRSSGPPPVEQIYIATPCFYCRAQPNVSCSLNINTHLGKRPKGVVKNDAADPVLEKSLLGRRMLAASGSLKPSEKKFFLSAWGALEGFVRNMKKTGKTRGSSSKTPDWATFMLDEDSEDDD
ncbi:hypothetical protein M231_06211 [Tremella mesenterica]|uniref:Uncharacterized protein n=1 Tax=Tremella mesenterica TaxID=5217 RepID=A0A4V1M3D5_TREME|nr:hypothetical protein M231_06211 [Tremella mesenterica]